MPKQIDSTFYVQKKREEAINKEGNKMVNFELTPDGSPYFGNTMYLDNIYDLDLPSTIDIRPSK